MKTLTNLTISEIKLLQLFRRLPAYAQRDLVDALGSEVDRPEWSGEPTDEAAYTDRCQLFRFSRPRSEA